MILLVLLFVVALGKGIDVFLLKDEKNILYKTFYKYDKIIEKTKTPKLHLLLINKVLSFFKKYFNFKKKPLQSFLLTFIISWTLTTLIGIPYILIHIKNGVSGINNWHDFLPWYPTYIINLVFDFLTVYITIRILNKIKTVSTSKTVIWIFIDIIFSYILVFLCHISFSYINPYLFLNTDFLTEFHSGSNSGIRKVKDFDFTYLSDRCIKIDTSGFTKNATIKIIPSRNPFSKIELVYFYKMMHWYAIPGYEIPVFNEKFIITFSENNQKRKFNIEITNRNSNIKGNDFIYSLTSFIPTLFFLLLLFLLIVYKKLFYIFKLFSSRYLKSNIEGVNKKEIDKFKPGTHLAIAISLLIATIKLVQEILKYLI